MAFKGDYLRVLTPITSDGVSPVVENDRIKYREDHLPLSAKKHLEKKNERLPTSLRKKIEVVSHTVQPVIKRSPKPVQPPIVHELDVDDLQEENLLEEEQEQTEAPEVTEKPEKPAAPEKPKGKRGPKKKNG